MKRTGGILILIHGAPGGGDAAGGWNEEDWGNINIDPWCPLGGGDAAGGCDWGMLIIDFFGTWCF